MKPKIHPGYSIAILIYKNKTTPYHENHSQQPDTRMRSLLLNTSLAGLLLWLLLAGIST
ncbi:hypothetical protein [Dechloromonas denitrificans]|uniref:hypothetical protein n=1 Tax=Dechloromonas denitrificans TaxID=281362 RepID=UPI0012F7AC1F|nr:hypothetical protein [Dechloromonas denitrificans]